jgi:hypothetical protein
VVPDSRGIAVAHRGVGHRARELGREYGECQAVDTQGDEQAAVSQVRTAERHAGEQVGKPRDGRVVAGEQQLAGQLAGIAELAEPRAREAALRERRTHQVGKEGRKHDPDGGEQRQRAGAKSDERQSEQEQHPVVGEDDRQTRVQGGEHQAEHGDQQGPDRQSDRPERPLGAVDGLARPGHQREADPSEYREQR